MKLRTLIVATAVFAVCGSVFAAEMETPTPPAKEKPAMTESVYVCPDCHAVALKPGKCACGKELVQMHLLGMKDGEALLCACGADCKCDFKGMKDGKCACGKEVKKASCKGIYCCPKGCPVMSDTPRKCACGDEMKKCE